MQLEDSPSSGGRGEELGWDPNEPRGRPHEDAEPDHTLGLEVMSDAVRYRRYLLELINPHCGRTIMEVGSGLGDLADGLKDYDRLVVTDVDPRVPQRALAALRRTDEGRGEAVRPPRGRRGVDAVDTVLAVNVLEHIQDDVAALRRMAAAVVPEGPSSCSCRPTRASTVRTTGRLATCAGTCRRPCARPSSSRLGRRAAPTRELPRWRGLVGRRPRRRMLESQEQSGRAVRPVRGPAGSPHGATMAPAIRSVDHLCSSGAEPDRLERDRSVGRVTPDPTGC